MSYTTTNIKEGFYYINKHHDDRIVTKKHKIKVLKGNATITSVGGNGNFKFLMGGKEFKTYCIYDKTAINNNRYYDYFKVIFDIDIDEKWYYYYAHSDSKEYWRPLNKVSRS